MENKQNKTIKLSEIEETKQRLVIFSFSILVILFVNTLFLSEMIINTLKLYNLDMFYFMFLLLISGIGVITITTFILLELK